MGEADEGGKGMRKYKDLVVPPRIPRTKGDLENKQDDYCGKTDCGKNLGSDTVVLRLQDDA